MSSVATLPKKVERYDDIVALLGKEAQYLLEHECKTVSKAQLHLPGPDYVDRVWVYSDRNPQVLTKSAGALFARTLRGYWLSFHFARGPGSGALGRCLLRPQPHLL
jgi:hypothetical protein